MWVTSFLVVLDFVSIGCASYMLEGLLILVEFKNECEICLICKKIKIKHKQNLSQIFLRIHVYKTWTDGDMLSPRELHSY